MPGADAEGDSGSEKSIAETPPAATTKKDGGGAKKDSAAAATSESATPLKWPATTSVTEDDKKLLQSNNKEIVQLFTLAQEVCKNMDNTLSTLSTQRDEANEKYRSTVQELDPLLQRIGAAQAENKNP